MKLDLDNVFKWIVVKNALENDKERMENTDYPDTYQSDIEVIDELLQELEDNCHYVKSE